MDKVYFKSGQPFFVNGSKERFQISSWRGNGGYGTDLLSRERGRDTYVKAKVIEISDLGFTIIDPLWGTKEIFYKDCIAIDQKARKEIRHD